MLNIDRKILRIVLGMLSKLAIKKHKIELIVVTGWYGTSVAREVIYTVLSEKMKIRRNTRDIWWDFSLPLLILGYEDKQRSGINWIFLIIKAAVYMVVAKSNPHSLLININCSDPSVIGFWSTFLQPQYLIILNDDRNTKVVDTLISGIDIDKGIIIYNQESIKKKLKQLLKGHQTFAYGKEETNELQAKLTGKFIEFKHKHKSLKIPLKALPPFSKDILGGVVSLAVLKGLSIDEISYNALKFEVPERILDKIRSNIKLLTV